MLTEAQRTSPGFLRGLALLRRLAAYHQYEAFGLDEILHIKTGAIVVLNHSLALYDAMLLQLAGYEASGRWVHPMADRLMFADAITSRRTSSGWRTAVWNATPPPSE